ncbi:MAG: hypothetical protein WAN93_00815 [Solirubrobacteraceae bacterium]
MKIRVGAHSVRTPSGQEWRVGRRWSTRRMPRWRKARMVEARPGEAAEAVLTVPDAGGLDDIGVAVLALLAVVVVVIVVIPLLLFGIELILLGLIVAAGVVGRTLLGRPWIVQATLLSTEAEELSWRVAGWRRSAHVIDEVTASLGAGLDPSPAEASAPMPPPGVEPGSTA